MGRSALGKNCAWTGQGTDTGKRARKHASDGSDGTEAVSILDRTMMQSLHIDWSDRAEEGPIYAVGDIHGMAGLLDAILLEIEADAANQATPARIVFLGDAVNRGPDSRQVIERLIAGPRRYGDEWLILRGNHEQSLLDALKSDAAFERFLQKGLQTMQSYGLTRKQMTRKGLRGALPAEHRAFLENMPLTCRTKDYVFVHAGVRPGKALQDQKAEDLMTLREPFFSRAEKLPWTVVHGHTPTAGHPLVAKGRIGIDTGACMTGVLTAVAIYSGQAPRFFSVGRKA